MTFFKKLSSISQYQSLLMFSTISITFSWPSKIETARHRAARHGGQQEKREVPKTSFSLKINPWGLQIACLTSGQFSRANRVDAISLRTFVYSNEENMEGRGNEKKEKQTDGIESNFTCWMNSRKIFLRFRFYDLCLHVRNVKLIGINRSIKSI